MSGRPGSRRKPRSRIRLNDDGGTVAIDDKGRLLTPHPYPQEYAAAVSRAVETGTVDIPAAYAGASRREQLLGPNDSHAALELDSPLGIAVESLTPTFRWQALPKATSYRVAVYGRGYQVVMTSGDLTATEWTPGEQLAPRCQLYLDGDGQGCREDRARARSSRLRRPVFE